MSDQVEEIPTPSKAIAPLGFNHVVLNVHDIEESHQFWCDMLGFRQVGELKGKDGEPPSQVMRFYSGEVSGETNHHDLALVERSGMTRLEKSSMGKGDCAVNHMAITYPDRDSWQQQVKFLQDNDVRLSLRMDHGMTHSVYLADPNGYGVEVLYELPVEVWQDDIDGALNYAKVLPREDMLVDDTNYKTDFS